MADALSRHDTEEVAELLGLTAPSFALFDQLRQENESEPGLVALQQEIEDGSRNGKWGVVDAYTFPHLRLA